MGVIDGRTGLEVLQPRECWELLSLSAVGRLGVLADSAPEIYPVNHVVDGETIVFRTDPGSKVDALEKSPAVCFQCDGVNLDDHTGWSVLVKGRAERLHGPEERRAASLPLHFWAPGEKARWIRIRPVEVTGRRVTRPVVTRGGPPAAR
jgi:nitroimidazol reductase NimA-like FMN-containing flavoprotein (pyridoxamine 5'-phosphate oxidase superfamily)